MRHFIAFGCYGAHLHGDESGSVDRRHNLFGGRLVTADPPRAGAERRGMDQPTYAMDSESRAMVVQALAEVCSHRGWNLSASRLLNRLEGEKFGWKRWLRHGST